VAPAGAIDVVVHARDDERVGTVLATLGRALGAPPAPVFTGTVRLTDEVRLDDVRLRHGAVLGWGRPVHDGASRRVRGALELRVVGGPDAGRTLALEGGRHVLGRGEDVEVRLEDPNVSRRHALLHVAGGTVEVTDLGSSNGTTLDGREVLERSPWGVGERLQIGATTLQVAGAHDAPAPVLGHGTGRTVLRPSALTHEVRPPVEITFPQPPVQQPARRLAWVAVALPAVGGVTLAVVLRTPTFLFFALLSPLVAIASWWSDRRSGRRTHRRELVDFEDRTTEAEERLADAVLQDARSMHLRHPDLAALASAARRRTSVLWSRAPGSPDHLTVRVGTGPGATTVLRCGPGSSRTAAPADSLPVLVDLRAGGLAVVGPRARALGVLRSAVGQLAALHPPDVLEIVVVASPAALADWRWARWLPHLRPIPVAAPDDPAPAEAATRELSALVERRRALARSLSARPWPGPWTAVVIDGPVPGPVATVLAGATDLGFTVLAHGMTAADVPAPVPTVLTVTGELGTHAHLRTAGNPTRAGIALDQLPLEVAARTARALAGLAPPAARSTLPPDVRLLDVAGPGMQGDGRTTGGWTRERGSLAVALGVGTDGIERIDLCRHGPHALVAGTTGSGKSELLQTLVAGLALACPPDRCSFLLVDYKGGAAFGEAAGLPHTVGLLTDLDDSTTARALRSLTAELTRREALLAAHGVADIADLPDGVALARLVIVVDEFATLAEELPTFVPGLVGIAQRGRSLGIHLVLATQRPAGVVSADIRANCTLRICLRTTDEADSRDVLGTPDAAHLPLELPGRAFVRAGTGPARLLQVARVSQPAAADDEPPVVTPWRWPLPVGGPARPSHGASDLAGLVPVLHARAAALSLVPPHRPWRPPLPASLPVREAEGLTGAEARSATQLLLGVVDRPDFQEQRPLLLDLAEGGGWLVVGGPRSGRSTVLRSALSQAVAAPCADRVHVHVVDAGGGGLLATAAPLPTVGTAVAADDALRSVRLVHRLAEEVARRRSAPAADDPYILLLVDGVESLSAVLDDADPARGSAELLKLVRDGGAVGVTCILTTDRAVPGGRLAGVARHRLVLPLPDRADYAVAGVPLARVPVVRPPGRALVGEEAAECQLVLPLPLDPARERIPRGAGRYLRPLRIVELDPDPLVDGAISEGTGSALRIAVGPGGDEGALVCVELLRTGGLLVAGPSGSGRSSALDAIAGDLAAAAVPVLRLDRALDRDAGIPDGSTCDLDDPAAVADWLAARAGAPAVVLVDDLGPAGSAAALAALPQLGSRSRVALIAAATAGDLSTWFQGPVAALRRTRSGLLLGPGAGDADVLGVRLPRTPTPVRPGSGWLVQAGGVTRVQVARHRAHRTSPHSSSSTAPISCVAYQASS
jgi:S-DNA-T family DNA segregation ATPase FtsK/SpoIIIE